MWGKSKKKTKKEKLTSLKETPPITQCNISDDINNLMPTNLCRISTIDGQTYYTYDDMLLHNSYIPTTTADTITNITTGINGGYTSVVPSTTISPYKWVYTDFKSPEEIEKEVVGNVSIRSVDTSTKGLHIMCCEDERDLAEEWVLKTLSAIKGKMMLDVAPVHIQKLECRMTPLVRKNIINASKKLKMYGKDMPIIARFDEYGNELPSEIRLCGESGITLVILDPEVNGKLYLELVAKEFPSEDYKQIWQVAPETIDATYLDDEYFHVKPLKITKDPRIFDDDEFSLRHPSMIFGDIKDD
jgi:hypothetical protein